MHPQSSIFFKPQDEKFSFHARYLRAWLDQVFRLSNEHIDYIMEHANLPFTLRTEEGPDIVSFVACRDWFLMAADLNKPEIFSLIRVGLDENGIYGDAHFTRISGKENLSGFKSRVHMDTIEKNFKKFLEKNRFQETDSVANCVQTKNQG